MQPVFKRVNKKGIMKTTYILGIITIAEIAFNDKLDASILLWMFYGIYKLLNDEN